MRIIVTIVLTIVFLILIGLIYMYSGSFNIAADSKDSALLDWILSTTRDRSIDTRAGSVHVPPDLETISTGEGFKRYHEMCEKCHGGPGLKPTDMNEGMNPRPPDLKKLADEMPAAEVLWVVKHGIKMSAMPSFGRTHSDQELLPAVSFVKKLPEVGEAEYADLLKKESKGRGKTSPQESTESAKKRR